MTSRITVPFHRSLAVAGASLLALLLGACGATPATPSPARTPIANASASPTPTGQPGVVGRVAAVSGTEVQVQNPSIGQVAVKLGTHTTITARTAGSLHDVKVGDCVTASGTPATGGAGLTARTLTVSARTAGSCVAGRGGPGNGGPSPRPRPSGRPTSSAGTPTATASGTVSAVSGGTITINGVLRTRGPRTSTPASAGPITVTTDNDTRIQRDARATRAAIRPGVCLAAFGPSNDIGTVQARTVSVFQPGSTGCTGGFAGRFGGGNG